MPPLRGWPHPEGSKEGSLFTHTGPNPYAAVVVGPPVTGGDVCAAREAGLHTFDYVESAISEDGLYVVLPIHANSPGNPMTTVILQWRVLATGAEAAAINLSASQVRLRCTGNH